METNMLNETGIRMDGISECRPDIKTTVLKLCRPGKVHGNRIALIARYFYYVASDARIEELANDLSRDENIHAVGVVDKDGNAIGMVVRDQLFSVLARPFGRDVFGKYRVLEIMKKTTAFFHDRNILSIAEEIDDMLEAPEPVFFLLKTHNNKFAGIFSSINMLGYLSGITKKDIILARKLHLNIVRDVTCLETNSFAFLGASSTAKGIGGDYYLIKEIEEKQWLIVICDVAGKGVAASLVTCVLGGMFNLYNPENGIESFIKEINHYFFRTFGPEKFITATFLLFNEKDGVINYYDMGHSHIYLMRKFRLFNVNIKTGNLPLGILPDITPFAKQLVLKTDDVLILLTDGIPEQTNPEGKEYGIKRFISIIKNNMDKSGEELKDAIFEDFYAFRDTQPLDDDATFLLFRYHPAKIINMYDYPGRICN